MVTTTAVTPSPVSDLRTFVEKQSGQRIFDCYQCGKCSAGCPVDYAMDLGPRQIMRYIQMGLKKEVMQSTTIWLCISCETCSSRCPAKIDIAKVMESLRILAADEGSPAAEKQIDLFHRTFLNTIRRYGRAHEFSLAVAYTHVLKREACDHAAQSGRGVMGQNRLQQGRECWARHLYHRQDREQALG
jgi:heterodisulfide reductase subunit C